LSKNSSFNIRFFEDKDENETIELVTRTFDALNEDLWRWKYLMNPNFDRSLVFVAENNGRVVACMHYLPRELKIARSLKVQAVLGADFAVNPDYRQQGIGSSMLRFSRSSRILENRGITVTYGFIDYRRVKFYSRNIDSTIIPLSTSAYKKYLDSSPIEEKLASLNKKASAENKIADKLRKTNMSIFFCFTGIPAFTLEIKNGKFTVNKGETLPHDITVEGYPYFFEWVSGRSKGTFSLLAGILKGKIKIRGSMRNILAFYRIIKTVRRLSS